MRPLLNKKKPIEPTAPPAPVKDSSLEAIVEIVKISENRINDLIEIDKKMAEALYELSRPKPKRVWDCSVGRDQKGLINNLNIKED